MMQRLLFIRLLFSCLLAILPLASAVANEMKSLRIWTSPEETRVVIDLSSSANHSFFTLTSPQRLVVDLKNTTNNAKLPVTSSDSPVLTKVRKSTPPNSQTTRLVFEMKSKVTANIFKLNPTPDGQKGHRLVIDLPHGATKKSTTAPTSSSAPTKDASSITRTKDVLIVIDPGHGGEDPGSIGPTKKYEKNATLAISKKLASRLNSIPGVKARLTRSGDYFVNLNRRVAFARENDAHLLISVHADAFTTPQPRGGSVFVLNTRRANTEISRWVENHEKQSELLGGSGNVISSNFNDKNVNQTLLDLQFSYSQKEGYKLATEILKEMGKVARLHKTKPVNTSLAVLRSPQIPSVLVETGFISNPTEERQLFQSSHQDKLAGAITQAIVTYLKANPPEGTVLSGTQSAATHKVKRGESLSLIAKKYGTTTNNLVKLNNLKSTSLAIGQVLKVTQNAPVANKAKSTIQTKTYTHTVKSGEYLGKIAANYKVSVAAIKRENNLKRETLWVGQKLKITTSVKNQPIRKHKVQRGEFLGKIASKYGVTINSIRKANKLRSDELAIGQTLLIPYK